MVLLRQSVDSLRDLAPVLLVVALSVGSAVLLGVLRILEGWPLHLMIIAGYGLVMGLTLLAPAEIIGIAYDAGGVTTSTITVPLDTTLGLGLADAIPGRDPVLDGFGMIALACLFPIITVMGYAQIAEWWERRPPR